MSISISALGRVMLAFSILLLLLGTVVASNAAAGLVVQRRSTTRSHGLLMTEGTQFAFVNGTTVILRGVNLPGYEQVPPIEWAHYKTDYATIASWGFNVVRLSISWDNIEPKEGVYDLNYLQKVDQDVAWAEQYGIYIVLDMHQMCWSSQFILCNSHSSNDWSDGIPKWAASSYPDNKTGMQLMVHDFFAGLGPNGTPPSPSNPSMQQRFFATWKLVASRYKNDTAIAGYDVLNEPGVIWNDLVVDPVFSSTTLPSFYTNAIDAIRTVDPYHICFWENPTDTAIQRPNVAYSPHYPQGSVISYPGTSALTASIQQIVSLSRQWNVPVYIGEWGMLATAPGVVQYIDDSLSLYNTYSISASWYDYAATGFGMDLFNPNGTPQYPLLQTLLSYTST